ncbi:hypothetical protein ASPWEDRAFT_117411 [Aspergillus wentii DTO 134E9]|uniref:Macro-like domain-containing protein n=1 Tax=Aspergillus wentii DTO 134E9 TaxID=1073089 RepID=A0A1L9RBX3_ASPWE|nr:uncharacterized protein ASPWEDRAFT_117411 [Aspergillus wentii DTO 134E9]KAI9934955.1 hypothetical protein MW887_000576 [Aspergillus wentii]OJJ32398.1 hypothetical protein ASPWEDRAFT_117411 [Aspergillus wentii DTO 134E9]
MTSNIPEIILLCLVPSSTTAFKNALTSHCPTLTDKISISHFNKPLDELDEHIKFDLVVSPANSYGRLDGAFDHAISVAFAPEDDYHALTRAAQAHLYEKYRGFAPPGTCTLVPFPEKLRKNRRGCKWVAICPTMKKPQLIVWDREVVYECVWSLLCAVEGWNRTAGKGEKIERILMTPLGTGTGFVSEERWAGQTVLAMKHFVDAVERPERWSAMEWKDISEDCVEVGTTWREK